MCECKEDVLVTAEEWAVISSGLQTAIAANFKLLAERTELRKQLAELLVLSAPQSQWVPVSVRLPSEDQGTVAVLFDDGHPGVAWATYWHGARTDFAQWTFPLDDLGDGREVTHWMPLPSAPGDTAAPQHDDHSPDTGKIFARQPVCQTCGGHGMVGSYMTAAFCPDCKAISSPCDGWEAMRQLLRELIAKANDCEAGRRLQDLHLFAAEKIKKVLAEAVK